MDDLTHSGAELWNKTISPLVTAILQQFHNQKESAELANSMLTVKAMTTTYNKKLLSGNKFELISSLMVYLQCASETGSLKRISGGWNSPKLSFLEATTLGRRRA